ncbi:MAG: hypothetical protein R3D98_10360 [Candidatus Krumholzibacteriia bacterium]
MAEVFSLRDVMREDLGPRRQGQLVSVRYAWSERKESIRYGPIVERGIDADLAWFRNPRLDLQWHARFAWQQRRSDLEHGVLYERTLAAECGLLCSWPIAGGSTPWLPPG